VLTVDYDRLGLHAGDRLLDLGCGAGRHAFEALRRGARVTAFDCDEAELKDVAALARAMDVAGEMPPPARSATTRGDATRLPFADGSFDRIIAAEVLEHIPADEATLRELVRVLRPGGRLAVTVPTRWPERICWALDRRYHDTPGGHIRIYRQPELEAKLERAGLVLRGSHHAHALHSPYWMLKCAVGVDNPDAWPVRKYHDFLVWDLTNRPRWARLLDRTLNPVLGKSLVIYTEKLQ
jgi:SAM-dependent methyltransferase